MSPRRPRRAGGYARRHGLAIRFAGMSLMASGAAVTVMAGAYLGGAARIVGVCVGVGAVTFGLARYDVGNRWSRGAGGERAVARRLRPLRRPRLDHPP